MEMTKNILPLLLSLGAVSGAHTMGHVSQGDRYGVDMNINLGNLSEIWDRHDISPERAARIHSAGFEAQDRVARMADNKPMYVANALYKLGYLAGAPKVFGAKTKGDLALLGKVKGDTAKKVAQGALTVSAISDLLKAFGKWKGDSGFHFGQSDTGTPMLMYGGRF